ncbi:hypothetical protein MGI18_13475 [Bacillus sp. OVS6]|nr:hypothetical protein MGI18_13475 [Bacillus sp. OVS6]
MFGRLNISFPDLLQRSEKIDRFYDPSSIKAPFNGRTPELLLAGIVEDIYVLYKITPFLKVNFQFHIVIDRGKEQQSTSAYMTHSKVVGKVQQFSRSIKRY